MRMILGGDFAGGNAARRSGVKRSFGDIDDDEDDIFGSKKSNIKVEETAPGVATGMILSVRESLKNYQEELSRCQMTLEDSKSEIQQIHPDLRFPVSQMQSSSDSIVLTQMAEMRLVCEREIPIQQRRVDTALTSYRQLFDSAKSEAQNTIQFQEKLGKLKGELREAEDSLVKAIAVKTRKEAKRIAIMESVSVMKARVKELKGLVKDQRERKDEYAAIISQQSEALTACEEKSCQNKEYKEQIEEAISWYNRVLGFRIECGLGVKFIFTNIRPENPTEEYSFVVRYENETYSLLKCDPHLSGTKELVNELNKSNGLFKFVRTMRERFQQAAAQGLVSKMTYNDYPEISLHSSSRDQDSSMISLSAPVASVSTDHTPEKGLQYAESNRKSRKVGKGNQVESPRSASSVRRSSRLKNKN